MEKAKGFTKSLLSRKEVCLVSSCGFLNQRPGHRSSLLQVSDSLESWRGSSQETEGLIVF